MNDDVAAGFELHRRYLVGLAYRMLGSVAEAEDAVQDAFLRWQNADRSAVTDTRAFLRQVVARLCLDRSKSAQAQREQYVGTWLPEPIVEDIESSRNAEDVSMALMMTLERLSPLERAAFLLHDVFDMDYSAVAGVLGRTEAACRQLATRAREHLRDERPRFEPAREAETRLMSAFAAALGSGEVAALADTLAEDAVFYSDGGGKRLSAINPVFGRDRIVSFFAGLARKFGVPPRATRARINGLPGFLIYLPDGVQTLALEISGEHVVALYAVRNPDKLRHLT